MPLIILPVGIFSLIMTSTSFIKGFVEGLLKSEETCKDSLENEVLRFPKTAYAYGVRLPPITANVPSVQLICIPKINGNQNLCLRNSGFVALCHVQEPRQT